MASACRLDAIGQILEKGLVVGGVRPARLVARHAERAEKAPARPQWHQQQAGHPKAVEVGMIFRLDLRAGLLGRDF